FKTLAVDQLGGQPSGSSLSGIGGDRCWRGSRRRSREREDCDSRQPGQERGVPPAATRRSEYLHQVRPFGPGLGRARTRSTRTGTQVQAPSSRGSIPQTTTETGCETTGLRVFGPVVECLSTPTTYRCGSAPALDRTSPTASRFQLSRLSLPGASTDVNSGMSIYAGCSVPSLLLDDSLGVLHRVKHPRLLGLMLLASAFGARSGSVGHQRQPVPVD